MARGGIAGHCGCERHAALQCRNRGMELKARALCRRNRVVDPVFSMGQGRKTADSIDECGLFLDRVPAAELSQLCPDVPRTKADFAVGSAYQPGDNALFSNPFFCQR